MENLSKQEIEAILNSNNIISETRYTHLQYLEAIEFIQDKTYLDPKIIWGKRWRQILANTMPMIIKLLYRGYNNFKVFPISTRNQKWAILSEEDWNKYAKSAGIALEAYHGVAYQDSSRNWITFDPNGIYYSEDNSKIVGLKLKYLSQVGALVRVCNEYRDLQNGYLYSSQYIISKDKLRELVSLYTHTFLTIHTHSTTSYTLSTSSNTTSSISSSIMGSENGAFDDIDKLIQQNNNILPEEEHMTYKGRRIYSEVCSYWNEDKMHTRKKEIGKMTKQDYLNKVFGQNNWFEFDRKGSIYNLTYSLNKKDYLDNSIDIYELMNGKPFASKEERQMFKATQMGVYFSTARRQVFFMTRVFNAQTAGKPVPEKDLEIVKAYWHFCGDEDWNTFILNFYDYYNKRKKLMKKVIGDNKAYIDKGSKYSSKGYTKNEDSFIFMKESEAYLKFVTKLRSRGLRVVQIYDGFYLQKGSISENELNNILKETIIEHITK